MHAANLLCLVVDRWHVGFVGALGNTWIATPTLDGLAAESFLFDQALADRPELDSLCRSLWQGTHAAERRHGRGPRWDDAVDARPWTLPAALVRSGRATALLTDEPLVREHPWAGEFGEMIAVEPGRAAEPAGSLDETHVAGVLAAAGDWLAEAAEPFALWTHLQGFGGPWDAPTALRERYADEDDPPPPEWLDLVARELPVDFDPDERWGLALAYAAQVSAFDAALAELLAVLADLPAAERTLVAVLGPRGLPLGEHRLVGPHDTALVGETLHVPWLLRWPDGRGRLARTSALVQLPDLAPTLVEALGLPRPAWFDTALAQSLLPLVDGAPDLARDRLLVESATERGVRTTAWFLREACPPAGLSPAAASELTTAGALATEGELTAGLSPLAPCGRGAGGEGSPRCWLYAKPDDRWEQNDVAARCADVVESLRGAWEATDAAVARGQSHDLAPLDAELTSDLR